MYSFSNLMTALREPKKALVEINRVCQNGWGYTSRKGGYQSGIDIVGADWDNLVLLDACRYDTFAERAADLPGQLRCVESRASSTRQFLMANFGGKELLDTVYVTANPQLYRIENGIYDVESIGATFHNVVEVWQDGWDEKHRTVRPATVTEAALAAAQEYPNKRLIVHYIQPHAPYIGPTGVEELPTDYLDFWRAFEDGEIDVDLATAVKAYEENLDLVLPHARTLLEELEGKTVVTADHGELFGERDHPIPIRRYGHPSYTPHRKLVEVPWLEYESGSRRTITAEERGATEEAVDDEVVKDRLRSLGYTE